MFTVSQSSRVPMRKSPPLRPLMCCQAALGLGVEALGTDTLLTRFIHAPDPDPVPEALVAMPPSADS